MTRLEAAIAEFVNALREEWGEREQPDHGVELLSIPEAARRLGIGRSRVYEEIGRGTLRSLKVGRRRLIPSDAIAERAKAAQ
jgi:excisionase family DNA binding protein